MFQQKRLMIEKPISDRTGVFRIEFSECGLDLLKWGEEFDLLSLEGSDQATKPIQRLCAEALGNDGLPA